MPVNIEFSSDKRYIVYTITDPMNMTELMNAYAQERTFRDSVPYTLHSIVDMSQIKRIPPNWLTAKAGPGLTHPRSGFMLFVGLSMGFKMILQTIMKIMRYEKIHFFDTRTEADAFMAELLQKEDSTASSTS